MISGSKLPAHGTTIFTVMSKMAKDYNAINLAQGFPDFKCSPKLISLVTKYMEEGHNQYAPMPGVLHLREQISKKVKETFGYTYNPETEITITCGATEACFTAITSLVGEGDEVIIPEPAFDVYQPAIELCKAKAVYVPMLFPEFAIDWNAVRGAITSRTKAIIINSPHNPTGAVITKRDITELEKIVVEFGITVISDEVYEHIVFDGLKHESVINSAILRQHALVIFSFGKTFHTTGWRVGYCLAPERLSAEFRKVHQYITFSAPTPVQFALADFLNERQHYQSLSDFFEKKRNLFLSLMKKSGFEFIPSKGTYFQLASYSSISDRSDREMAEWLTKEHGVASIPVSVFYSSGTDNRILRFCFAKEDSTLQKAAEKLCRI